MTIYKIEVTENKIVQVCAISRAIINGETKTSNHRYCISPGDDFSVEPEEVKAVCAIEHTDSVVFDFRSLQNKV